MEPVFSVISSHKTRGNNLLPFAVPQSCATQANKQAHIRLALHVAFVHIYKHGP